MDSLGFVILTWNSENVIKDCLSSIQNLGNYKITVFIIDNGSEDKTMEIIEEMQPLFSEDKRLECIALEENKGTTKSRNIGLKKLSDVDWVCILDSDTQINQDAIDGMIGVLKENAQNGIVGPRMLTSEGKIQNSGRRIPTLTEKICKVLPVSCIQQYAEKLERYEGIEEDRLIPVGYLMSACWVMRSEMIEEIGFLDENIFYAPEDVEYCIRAWKSGYRVLFDGRVRIIHEWQRLSRKKLISKHNVEHVKGLLYLYKKYRFLFRSKKIEKLVT